MDDESSHVVYHVGTYESAYSKEKKGNKGEGEMEKINELHLQITAHDSIITALHFCVHRSKNSEKSGVRRGNYSHCGGTLLLRFLLPEFHFPSLFLSNYLRGLLCDS